MTSAESETPPRAGPILCLWVGISVALHGALWITGFESKGLADAVERGAARVEASRAGEVGDDLIRKAIRLQRETLPFWTTLARLGDFAFEPAVLVLRALTAATLLAAVAALTGRPIGFSAGLAAASRAQGFWVFGQAVAVGLMISLRRSDVETSLALFLPPGPYPAATVLLARQVDPFAMLGWLAIALGGWRLRQANLATAASIVVFMALTEAITRVSLGLIAGAGMRLSILPG